MTSLLFDAVGGPVRHALQAYLQSSLGRYIKGIQLEGLGLLGDIVTNNLELNLDALRDLLPASLPFEFTRGFVRELRITIPWTSLFGTPIHVRLDTVEVVVSTRAVGASNAVFT